MVCFQQVELWTPELMELEVQAKEKAKVILFVVDAQTRAVGATIEATEHICDGREVVLVVEDIAAK